MRVEIQTTREGERARLVPAGAFDLAHAATAVAALQCARANVDDCHSIELELTASAEVDSTGAVLLARLLDRFEASGHITNVLAAGNPQAARLIALYRTRRSEPLSIDRRRSPLARIGHQATRTVRSLGKTLDFVGSCAIALPRAAAMPRSVDWRSLPALIQEVGADSLPVTSAANLLVGLIIAVLGVSQLGRFGAVSFVPELVVVAQFRELGPLVTAIVVAGRSGAGIASEIATMKVSEEVDALRSIGFDPMRWLVLPRCLAIVAVLPLLTWMGDVMAITGGLIATTATTGIPMRAYLAATADAITPAHFVSGMIKTPFLALGIGLIACGQGLATQGGAAGVGARTTRAVVLAIFSVIVINSLFTCFYILAGI